MWNPTTGGIHETRDVVWLKRMYYIRQPTALEITTGVNSEVRESAPTVQPGSLKNARSESLSNIRQMKEIIDMDDKSEMDGYAENENENEMNQ